MSHSIDVVKTLIGLSFDHLESADGARKDDNVAKERMMCLQAVILFQSAMEALINEEIASHPLLQSVKREEAKLNTTFKSLSFRNKWIHVFDVLRITKRSDLEAYLDFYSRYRVPITHAKSRFISLEKYTYGNVKKGIESGVKVMKILKESLVY